MYPKICISGNKRGLHGIAWWICVKFISQANKRTFFRYWKNKKSHLNFVFALYTNEKVFFELARASPLPEQREHRLKNGKTSQFSMAQAIGHNELCIFWQTKISFHDPQHPFHFLKHCVAFISHLNDKNTSMPCSVCIFKDQQNLRWKIHWNQFCSVLCLVEFCSIFFLFFFFVRAGKFFV